MGTFTYLKSLLKDRNVASITPSSSFTVKKATRNINFSEDIVIVEFGPGTGVFSEYILKKMTPGSRLIMIELNKEFADILHGIEDERISVYNESAENVHEIIENEALAEVDYFLSGIPFSFLPEPVKDIILSRSAALLKPHGYFLAYQTSTHLKKPLLRHFRNVKTEFELRNLPPMCIYEANGKKM
jgi:phosphatidylethanolamine/phosphatidyl-N-methylethanolamine N-methyltransferase